MEKHLQPSPCGDNGGTVEAEADTEWALAPVGLVGFDTVPSGGLPHKHPDLVQGGTAPERPRSVRGFA